MCNCKCYSIGIRLLWLLTVTFTKSVKYVTGFAKRGLIHASDFATLMSHNFVCDYAITLKVSPTIVQ